MSNFTRTLGSIKQNNMTNFFIDIIDTIDNSVDGNSIPNVNPTEIYNEGWMTRLLVYTSINQKLKINDFLDFSIIKNWSSEGLISSPFIDARKNREGYTHADMALGDFEINYSNRGQIEIRDEAKLFGIIEAKMRSNLSKGTTNAKDYNQASRNLACISYNANGNCKTFFAVVAPEAMIENHAIKEQIEPNKMLSQIRNRYTLSGLAIDTDLLTRAAKSEIFVLSYEDWIDRLTGSDKEYAKKFYDNCKKWNRL